MGDFAGSAAVILAAMVIAATGWTGADAVASTVVGLLILPRTWGLLRDADGCAPRVRTRGLDMARVRGTSSGPRRRSTAMTCTRGPTSGINVISAH